MPSHTVYFICRGTIVIGYTRNKNILKIFCLFRAFRCRQQTPACRLHCVDVSFLYVQPGTSVFLLLYRTPWSSLCYMTINKARPDTTACWCSTGRAGVHSWTSRNGVAVTQATSDFLYRASRLVCTVTGMSVPSLSQVMMFRANFHDCGSSI